MAKKKQQEQEISIRAYAALLKVNEKTVRKARDSGLLGKGYNGLTAKIIPSLADKAWGDNQKIIKPKAGVSRAKAIKKLEEKERKKADVLDKSVDLPQKLDKMSTQELLSYIEVTTDMPLILAMRYREIIALALDKIKLQKEEGFLVEKDLVYKELFSFGTQLKKALLSIPGRVIDDMLAASNKVEAINILTVELNEVLRVFSGMTEVKQQVNIK